MPWAGMGAPFGVTGTGQKPVILTVQVAILRPVRLKSQYLSFSVAFAPEGRPIPAQRNALGKVRNSPKPCEGRPIARPYRA